MGIRKYDKHLIILVCILTPITIGISLFLQIRSNKLSNLVFSISPISANGLHSLAIMENGDLWSWGHNEKGQLGDGTKIDRLLPVWIMDDIVSVSGGNLSFVAYSLALRRDGSLFGWGNPSFGQLGIGGSISASQLGTWSLLPPFSPLHQSRTWENSILRPVKIKRNIINISAGNLYATAIRVDGVLFGWGDNINMILPRNSFFRLRSPFLTFNPNHSYITKYPEQIMRNIVSISAGNNYMMAIDNQSNLWGWGDNRLGQIGDVLLNRNIREEKIMSDILEVSAGSSHTAVIKKDGSLWTWGANTYGQLGNGEEAYELNHHITKEGETIYWRTAVQDNTMPIKVMEDVIRVSVGNAYTMAITSYGELWAWGYNSSGQLGDGTTVNRLTPTFIMDDVVYVSAGSSHTLTIRTDGSLWAWGNNEFGQLGDGTTVNRHLPVRIIEAGLMMPN